MGHRHVAFVSVLAVLIAVVSVSDGPIAAQAPEARSDTWTPPRTAAGHPDLQGVWMNNTATPFERPEELEGRRSLTDAEVEALQEAAGTLFNGEADAAFGDAVFKAALAQTDGQGVDIKATNGFDVVTGNYNQFWLVDREFDGRTSVVVDPPDGRIPPLTPAARDRRAAAAEHRRMHPADGPEDLPLGHRCVNFGVPKVGAGYNSYHQIFQTRDHVAILSEMAHDARIIPIDGHPHVADGIRQWNGDARGRFEGNTLVIETRNFSPKSQFRGANEQLYLVERFTPVGPNSLRYEFSVTDPTTWTRSWTGMIPFERSDEAIYEYACHEGNEGLPGALRGYRAQEKAAAAAQRSK